VLDGFVGKELRHQIQLSVAEPQSIQDHGDGRRSHAYLLAIARVLGIQHRRQTDLLAHACHDA